MAKRTIQPAIEFDAEERGGIVFCELSCDSCTGTRLEVPSEGVVRLGKKNISCAACGANVALGPAIAQVLNGDSD